MSLASLTIERDAVLAFRGKCRLALTRSWDISLPRAAWLLTNPSEADAYIDDPTVKRMIHFSAKVGAGRLVAVNYRPWRTPYPAELWRAIKAGLITDAMMDANDGAIRDSIAFAPIRFAAFGAEPPRRDREALDRALAIFMGDHRETLCLGVNGEGWPLHPVARGKFAIRNDTIPRPWTRPE